MRESYLQKGQEPPRVGPFKLTGQILKADGVGGLFRGLTPTFMREMPGYFCFFYAYEVISDTTHFFLSQYVCVDLIRSHLKDLL